MLPDKESIRKIMIFTLQLRVNGKEDSGCAAVTVFAQTFHCTLYQTIYPVVTGYIQLVHSRQCLILLKLL